MSPSHPTTALNTRIERYRSTAVRDLVWAILSPTLIVTPDVSQHYTPAWYEQAFLAIEPHLQQLEQDDTPLAQHLTTPHVHRLGAYFERLWSYWLQHNGRYTLLAANLQVQTGNQTLGEFDLIVRDTHADEIEHWELAVKFYLGVTPLHSANHWFGPNHQDRLDLKYHHLVQHQLPLSQTHAGQQTCAAHGWNIERRRLISKGRLYFPGLNAESHNLPRCIDPAASHGHWLTQTEFARLTPRHPQARYRKLGRDEWMVTQRQHDMTAQDLLSLPPLSHPLQLDISGWQDPDLRLFVVPDTWREQALSTLSN